MTHKTRIGSLDFNDIKADIKKYLSEQDEFTDYNFEGSGLNVLLNLLAYNSHYNALSANYLANEMFMDTAVKRSSVVSRAKENGYTTRSKIAATIKLTVKFTNVFNDVNTPFISMPKGFRFTSSIGENNVTFTTAKPYTFTRTLEGVDFVYIETIDVYEGLAVENTVIYNPVDKTVSIPNKDIDMTTLKVEVSEDGTGDVGSWVEYVKPNSFLTLLPTDKVYMSQEGFDGYEIYFGDDLIGVNPPISSKIKFSYVATSGLGNGARSFSKFSSILDSQGLPLAMNTTITPLGESSGGLLEESIDSIKLNTKNHVVTQNRAVIKNDYAAIAKISFPSIVKDCFAWDGSDNIPPRFGKVILSVQPTKGDALTKNNKDIIASYLKDKSVGNIGIDFIDPELIQLKIATEVRYDTNLLTVDSYEIDSFIRDAIIVYTQDAIHTYNSVVRHSGLSRAIDNSNYAIVSNLTTLKLSKSIIPNIFTKNNIKFSFVNEITSGTLISTRFLVPDSSNIMRMVDDGSGNINIVYWSAGNQIIHKPNIGMIDYKTGILQVDNLIISELKGFTLDFDVKPTSQDLKSSQNVLLELLQENVIIELLKDYK